MSDHSIFVLRLKGREETSFKENVIGIGWSEARELESVDEWVAFKKVIHDAYPNYSNSGLGNIGGSIWNFIHGMKAGSLVVVPLPGSFTVAEVLGDLPFYDESGYKKDYAWRRKVKWITEKPVPRRHARNTLQRKMKCQQTCIDISDLHEHVQAALARTGSCRFVRKRRNGTHRSKRV